MNSGYWIILPVVAFVLTILVCTINLESDKATRWSSYWSFSATLLALSLFFVEAEGYISFAQGAAIYLFFVIAWALSVLKTWRLVKTVQTMELGEGAQIRHM